MGYQQQVPSFHSNNVTHIILDVSVSLIVSRQYIAGPNIMTFI
jgi:hypothetical protein